MQPSKRFRTASRLYAGAVVFTLLVLTTTIGFAMVNYFSWEPDYNRNVHGHMENAYYADTPELMIEELETAKQGMVDLGLEPSMYSDLRPWKQTPDRTMAYQYRHLDAIIERAHAVIEWREENAGGGEINDVYGSKMKDLRAFITEDGWSDWIAKDTYYITHHPVYAAWYQFGGLVALAWFVVLFALVAIGVFYNVTAFTVAGKNGHRCPSLRTITEGRCDVG